LENKESFFAFFLNFESLDSDGSSTGVEDTVFAEAGTENSLDAG
jgi:hypothetical protein